MKGEPPVTLVCPRCGRALIGTYGGYRLQGGSVTARSRARTALQRHIQDVHGVWGRELSLLLDTVEVAR
jgi:hypothetical protein